nr:MFS transporter [Microbacterium excoecariae]
MSADLGVTPSAAGQTVTVYAIGSAAAAIPLTMATIGWPRRRLLLTAVAGFALTNLVTALSTDYLLTMVARFGAGVVAGLVWALLAGYARRMVAPGQRGRAMAIAMAGTPPSPCPSAFRPEPSLRVLSDGGSRSRRSRSSLSGSSGGFWRPYRPSPALAAATAPRSPVLFACPGSQRSLR